jgi:hypothetical protein
MEGHLGRQLRGIVVGMNISWDLSRVRGIGRWSEVHIAAHRDHGFHCIMNADSTGT